MGQASLLLGLGLRARTLKGAVSALRCLLQIGLPHARLWEGMEAEHCKRQDSKDEFNPGNYDTTTTPSLEWLVVTNDSKRQEASVGPRLVRAYEEVMEDSIVKQAKLRKEEIVALILYTGPMFVKYNAVLRGFPEAAVEALKGNKYTTTIYCIVSGIIKLSKVMKLPDDRVVYRGMGGLELPEAFTIPDEWGIRGGVEYGMMSTTLHRLERRTCLACLCLALGLLVAVFP